MSARISKHTDGVKCLADYLANNAEHRSRSGSIERDAAGNLVVPNKFSAILKKVILNSPLRANELKSKECPRVGD